MMAEQVSFARDILRLFRTVDLEHMRSMGVVLDDYEYMSNPDNARKVYESLLPDFEPRMPIGGPYWTQQQLDLFSKWMNDGYLP